MDAEERYNRLSDKVKAMLEVQRMYFKSHKDIQLLKKAKALEKEVEDILYPKKAEQQSLFDHLAR